MTSEQDSLAARRFRVLITQLRDEVGAGHGWKTRVGTKLGLTQPAVTMLFDGRRQASKRTLEKAMSRLGLSSTFFYDDSLGDEPRYRSHLKGSKRPPKADPPHWIEFVERYKYIDSLSEEELADIKDFAARRLRVESWTDWERVAEWVRTSQPSKIHEDATKDMD